MSREIVAPAVLCAAQLSLLVLHRHVPERTLLALLTAAGCVNDPARLALFHFQDCEDCTESATCDRGRRLVAACHGWRPRSEAAS